MVDVKTIVSFIISVFNKESYISLVLEAILNQKGIKNFEVIVVDDGSTDESLKKIKKFKKKFNNIKIISQVNCGPSVACNKGLCIAKGYYIKFVDADDILTPWATKMLIDTIEKNKSVMAFSRNIKTFVKVDNSLINFYNQNKIKAPEKFIVKEHFNFFEKSLHVSNMNLSCIICKRSDLLSFGGCNEKIFCPDYFVELMLTSSGKISECKDLVFLTPHGDKKRISNNEAQVLHDLNFALEEFFNKRKEFLKQYGKKFLKRANSRQFNFVRRNKISAINVECLIKYLLNQILFLKPTQKNFYDTRKYFIEYFNIRTGK